MSGADSILKVSNAASLGIVLKGVIVRRNQMDGKQ